LHSSHSSLLDQLSSSPGLLCQSPTYSNLLAAKDLRSRVGPVRSCSVGSCNAFQSPYLPSTWVCNSLYAYPCLLLRIRLCVVSRKAGTSQSTWSAVAIPPAAFPPNAFYSFVGLNSALTMCCAVRILPMGGIVVQIRVSQSALQDLVYKERTEKAAQQR
jgi:hypothetical protein